MKCADDEHALAFLIHALNPFTLPTNRPLSHNLRYGAVQGSVKSSNLWGSQSAGSVRNSPGSRGAGSRTRLSPAAAGQKPGSAAGGGGEEQLL